MTISSDLTIYILSFVAIWIGSGLIVSSANKIALKLRLPAFIISFVFLGILTSSPEIAVGLTAIASNTPSIFVGNLLGGVPVLFFLLVPLLAIFGKGISLDHKLGSKTLAFSFVSAVSPFFVVLDGRVTITEGLILIIIYLIVVLSIYFKNDPDPKNSNLLNIKKYSFFDIIKVLAGTGIVLFSSNLIVDKTLFFSNQSGIAPFYISIIFLSIGTNLPEISIALKSIVLHKKQIAFGNYLGSAAANACLFGLFTLINGVEFEVVNSFSWLFGLVIFGVFLTYYFAKSKSNISAKEGFILLFVYILFIYLEFFTKT